MIIKPEQIAFENRSDIVNYVSKGLVPTRKNFEKVMLAVRYPTPEGANPSEGEVRIHERALMDCDNQMLVDVLQEVYKNRVRNRNITLATIGIVAAAILLGKRSSSKDEDTEVVDNTTDTDNE